MGVYKIEDYVVEEYQIGEYVYPEIFAKIWPFLKIGGSGSNIKKWMLREIELPVFKKDNRKDYRLVRAKWKIQVPHPVHDIQKFFLN